MIQLDDRRVALELRKLIRREIDGALRTRVPVYHYGPVFSVDTVKKTCSVLLKGLAQPSPGFVYSGIAPRVGEFVRVFVNPNGDRYVDSVQGRDIVGEIVDVVTPPAIPPDRALHIPIRVAVAAGVPGIVQMNHGNGSIVMPGPITAGNTLLYLAGVRSTTFGALPGYALSPEGITADGPDDKIAIYRKVAGVAESTTLAVGETNQGGAWVELPGIWTFDAQGHDDGTGTTETAGPISVAPNSFVLALGEIGAGGGFDAATGCTMTPGPGWSELHDLAVTDGHPRVWVGIQYSATGGSVTGQATIAPADAFDWAMQIVSLVQAASSDGLAAAPEATDADDVTYVETGSTEAFRIDLGAAYRIVRARILIASELAGAKTYQLRAANQGDYSDEVIVATVAYVAAGGFATNDVTVVWPSTTAYRFWRLVGPSEIRRVHTVEMYEQTSGETIVTDPTSGDGTDVDAALAALAASIVTEHEDLNGRELAAQHPASALTYDPTTSGLTATDTQAAIDELAALSSSSSLPWFFPEDYGAAGDDTGDDLAALNAAVAAAAAAGGGQIALPGKYAISGTLSITDPHIHLRGFGNEYGPSQIRITAANTTAIDFPSSWPDASRTYQGSIRDLKVKGPGGATSGAGIKAASNIDLSHVGIHGFYDGLMWHTATYYSRARDCFITGCVRYGIYMSGCNNCTVDTCRITGDPLGVSAIDPVFTPIYVDGGIANRIVFSSLEYFSGHGLVFAGGRSPVAFGNYFETQQSSTGFAHIYVGMGSQTYSPLIESNTLQGDGIAGFVAIIFDNAIAFRAHGNTLGIASAIGTSYTAGASGGFWWGNTNDPAGTILLPPDTITSPGGFANPMTTAGDLIYGGASGAPTRKAIGSPGDVLTVSGGNPVWAVPAAAPDALDDLTDVVLATPAEDETLRFDGTNWINDNRRWEPVTFDPGTGPEIVFTSSDIVMTWETY